MVDSAGYEKCGVNDEQLQYNRGCYFLMQALFPESFPFYQFTT